MVRENRFVTTKDVIRNMEVMANDEGLSGAALGRTANAKRRFNSIKQKAHGYTNLGSDRGSIVVPPPLQRTENGQQFLLQDNAGGSNRMLIFASADSLDVSIKWTSVNLLAHQ